MEIHIVFTYPTTGQRVDHVFDKPDERPPLIDRHEMVVCLSCAKVHFINRQTGKLLGHKD